MPWAGRLIIVVWCMVMEKPTLNFPCRAYPPYQEIETFFLTPTATIPCFDWLQGTAVFDFSGTGPQVEENLNAPRAVSLSAIIYCLRCMVGHDVPLNQVHKSGDVIS